MSRVPADLINVPLALLRPSEDNKHLHVKNQDRWEPLKPVIVELYTGNYGKNNKPPTIAQIAEFMKNHYSFYATVSAYANRFRQWGVSDRRLTKAKLNEIAVALERHPTAEISTSKVSLKRGACEAKLDVRQVKRHLANDTSYSKPKIMQSGWLSSWTLPYAALVSALPKNPGAASPFGTQPATPHYLEIKSERPSDEPIFAGTFGGSYRQICVDYFHEFYMHGFLTAKNWGSPPSIINVRTPSGFTPSAFFEFPSSPLLTDASNHIDIVNPPTNLCRWSIHFREVYYEALPEESPDSYPTSMSFPECLQNSISTGDFTELRNDNLPLSHETIVHALTENPVVLELDSWKLAIMAGNTDLLLDLGMSDEFRALSRFPGEEKDICGRWDADSPELGMPGETLFGPLAILVCLINMDVDVNMRMNISVEEILRTSEPGQCRHEPMTAAEMMLFVPESVVHNWTNACQVGWDCLLHTLRWAEVHQLDTENSYRDDRGSPEYELCAHEEDSESEFSECELRGFHDDIVLKCTHKKIGILWATIQAEFLTYRRLTVNDLWISDNFQMVALQAWLKGETQGFNTPLVVQGMMKTYSRCGWFYENKYNLCVIATASDVCKEWFANLDNYERTTFVPGVEIWDN
ncbi:hypothetical protein FAUST_1867 [Fusarium austroamericanum]|uniref:Clr5 domain-containing protein n=1 Tax=Fusarium austroamericanum TaxID=282268 RepID=A0AAN6HJ59_FUSAU|nr:hypothetical protein FAUST_1867 [Fusarium austroamericanum]